MFEQSMLLDHPAGKRTGALAASITAQTVAVGVLVLVPLIYNDRLPDVRRLISVSMPLPPPAAPPEPEHTAVSPSAQPSLSPRKPFQAPTHVSTLSAMTDPGPIDIEPPSLACGNCVFGSVPGPAGNIGLGRLIEAVPATRAVDPVKKVPDQPQRVGGEVQMARLVKKVIPEYPPLARQARISGTVRLIGVIAKDGTIQQLQVVSGHPLLINAALAAVRQWAYRPTLLNGQPVEVIAPIDVIFTLAP